MSKINKKNAIEKTTTLDGMMTFGKLDDGLNALDFSSFEAVEMEPFSATCKVQAMRDGNYYFVFKLSEELVKELPDRLVQQSLAIAQKVQRGIIGGKEATE